MATRYSSFEPRGKGAPNGGDAFDEERSSYASATGTERTAAMVAIEEQPLSAEDCAIGEVVAGKYLIEGVIGRGSMGVVVRATHLGFDELVALKFIRPEMRKVDGIVSRFAREAKASVRIRNEHAVNVLDVGVADPIGPFFVMEYLEGINLEELVDSQGPFDPAISCKYILQACEALAAAHAQGIIHRDIKPQNMFLAWQGRLERIKVLDFGISKAALSGQVFGDDLSIGERDWVMGTPLYMSPEQLRHAPDVDERTDIWSLGAVLYELLVGRPLFSGDTQTEVCRRVFEADRHSIRVDIPSVPDALWEVIERCLAQHKEQRYENVADLGLALLPFAPAAACLHIERARALLGLEHLDFTFDEPIEEIDAEPIDDEAEPEAAMPLVTGKHSGSPPPAGPRRPYWVELVLPVLACIVLWIGYRQWQQGRQEQSREAAASRDEAVQTVALALRQSGFGSEPPRADCPVPGNDVPGKSGAPTGAASESSVASGGDGTQGSPPPLAAQHASGARRASPPAASSAPAGSPAPPSPTSADARPKAPASSSEAPKTQFQADAAAESARRASKPKPKVEAKPQFRLIDELPQTPIELVPNGSPLPSQPASSPAPTTR